MFSSASASNSASTLENLSSSEHIYSEYDEDISLEVNVKEDVKLYKNSKNKKILIKTNDGNDYVIVIDKIYNHSLFLREMFSDNEENDNTVTIDVSEKTLLKSIEFYEIVNKYFEDIVVLQNKLDKISESDPEYYDIYNDIDDIEEELEKKLYFITKPLRSTELSDLYIPEIEPFLKPLSIIELKDLCVFSDKIGMNLLTLTCCIKFRILCDTYVLSQEDLEKL